MRLCIVNYADGRFKKGQERLRRSLEQAGFAGDFLAFDSPLPGWPSHEKAPWGFKPYAFEEARKRGYDAALWIDASGMLYRPLEPVIKIVEERGALVFCRYSSSVGEWSSDLALEKMGVSREEAFHIPEVYAFCLGINFKHEKGQEFLARWKELADNGAFLGVPDPYSIKDSFTNDERHIVSKDRRVKGHRHDQTAASVAAREAGIRPTRYHVFDLEAEAKPGAKYADYIPLDAQIVMDRDIKTDDYLADLAGYRTTPLTFFKTLQRYCKDFLKYLFVYKGKYNL